MGPRRPDGVLHHDERVDGGRENGRHDDPEEHRLLQIASMQCPICRQPWRLYFQRSRKTAQGKRPHRSEEQDILVWCVGELSPRHCRLGSSPGRHLASLQAERRDRKGDEGVELPGADKIGRSAPSESDRVCHEARTVAVSTMGRGIWNWRKPHSLEIKPQGTLARSSWTGWEGKRSISVG